MFRSIDLWRLPAEQLYSKTDFICEMDKHDHAFICGMLREKSPGKLLEIGIAEGGTTAIIINALSLLGGEREVYSVDLNERLYCDQNKNTGYEYERLCKYIDKTNISHQIFLGDSIAKYIEKIGGGIDFVIIDTTHQLPGEILDFLCVLPYLSKGATVVLHDVNLNYIRAMSGNRKLILHSPKCIATKLLFSAVTAEKYLSMSNNNLPNIAAFTVTEDTRRYISDLFHLLSLTWTYIPEKNMLENYKLIYEKFYDEKILELFDIAVKNNQRIFRKLELARNFHEESLNKYRFPYNIIPNGSKVVIYGAGLVGKEVFEVQRQLNMYNIVLWVDKMYKEYAKEGLEVENPEMLLSIEFDYIVVAVENKSTFQSICNEIALNGWNVGKPIIGPISDY